MPSSWCEHCSNCFSLRWIDGNRELSRSSTSAYSSPLLGRDAMRSSFCRKYFQNRGNLTPSTPNLELGCNGLRRNFDPFLSVDQRKCRKAKSLPRSQRVHSPNRYSATLSVDEHNSCSCSNIADDSLTFLQSNSANKKSQCDLVRFSPKPFKQNHRFSTKRFVRFNDVIDSSSVIGRSPNRDNSYGDSMTPDMDRASCVESAAATRGQSPHTFVLNSSRQNLYGLNAWTESGQSEVTECLHVLTTWSCFRSRVYILVKSLVVLCCIGVFVEDQF